MPNQEIDLSAKKHTLSLKNREKLALDGVREVVSFDEGGVILETTMGILTVEGTGLHVTRLLLDVGEVSVEGEISLLAYSVGREKRARGLLRRTGG